MFPSGRSLIPLRRLILAWRSRKLDEMSFDAGACRSRLDTRWIGRRLEVWPELESTNDEAWDLLAAGAAVGTVIVADVQTRGRGRSGRTWHHAPRRGLALSVLLLPREGGARLSGGGGWPWPLGRGGSPEWPRISTPRGACWSSSMLAAGRRSGPGSPSSTRGCGSSGERGSARDRADAVPRAPRGVPIGD